MKYVSYLIGGLSAAATLFYLVVYLYRWQWNRALICGVLFVAIEVFLLGVVVLSRMSRLEHRIADTDSRGEEVRRRLAQARLEQSGEQPGDAAGERFRWLDAARLADPAAGQRVFIPVLLAAGVVLSGISWVVQRIARMTVVPGADRHLAGRLAALAAPSEGALRAGPRLEDTPAIPPPRPGRTTAFAAVALAGVVGLTAGIDALGDATQSRPGSPPDSAATTLVFRVDTRSPGDAQHNARAAGDLWEGCRHGITVGSLDNADLSQLGSDVFALVVRPALTENDLARLRGCLVDANAPGIQASFLGEGQATPSPWLP
ncbi:hypothetical protein [Streptodolium elevatio]|uniref:Uncharacterized protein n=1 Tax=Streptodolium elevatio TaxID=3157996 RepID=A0ABV3DN12_9ACTN